EGLSSGLLLDLRMHGALTADIRRQLLAFRREAEALEQTRCIGVRRLLEQAVRPDHQGRSFGGVDRLGRGAALLDLEDLVLVAVGLDGALAKRELLWWIGGRLKLHHILLGEFFQILPAE